MIEWDKFYYKMEHAFQNGTNYCKLEYNVTSDGTHYLISIPILSGHTT